MTLVLWEVACVISLFLFMRYKFHIICFYYTKRYGARFVLISNEKYGQILQEIWRNADWVQSWNEREDFMDREVVVCPYEYPGGYKFRGFLFDTEEDVMEFILTH